MFFFSSAPLKEIQTIHPAKSQTHKKCLQTATKSAFILNIWYIFLKGSFNEIFNIVWFCRVKIFSSSTNPSFVDVCMRIYPEYFSCIFILLQSLVFIRNTYLKKFVPSEVLILLTIYIHYTSIYIYIYIFFLFLF